MIKKHAKRRDMLSRGLCHIYIRTNAYVRVCIVLSLPLYVFNINVFELGKNNRNMYRGKNKTDAGRTNSKKAARKN